MKSNIWIDTNSGFCSNGNIDGLIFSAENDELLAEVAIEFYYDRKNDEETLTFKIERIYENTKQTESQLYDELTQHGKDLLQDEICEYYNDRQLAVWGI